MPRKVLITIRRGTETQLKTVALAVGELGFTTDTNKLFIGTDKGNVQLTTTAVGGDMFKSIYDTNNDGLIDNAANSNMLQGHPASDFLPKGPITWNQLKGV